MQKIKLQLIFELYFYIIPFISGNRIKEELVILLFMDYLFIDFDGVICDSVNEAYISSWLALYGLKKRESSISGKIKFCTYRPYIKAGADFMILQNCIKKGIVLSKQSDFDVEYEGLSKRKHKQQYKQFYKARNYLFNSYPDFWFKQNSLYKGWHHLLPLLKNNTSVYILSTKKSEFILEILRREGIKWPADRVLYSRSSEKIKIIEEYLSESETKCNAVLVEDQSEYFTAHQNITFALASWGYITDSCSASQKADHVLKLEELKTFFLKWIT